MDLTDLTPSKYNDKYKYLLNVIDIFLRYAWSVSLKDKNGKSIAAALTMLFENRKPIIIQSNKGTQFVNATVQQYLKRQGIDFHTTHNPDIKGAVIERFKLTLKKEMYKYFIKNNFFRYLDVINSLLASYNNSVHSAIAITPGKLSPSNIYSVWRKINSRQAKIRHGRVNFKVGDFLRITKQEVAFAKGYEQIFLTEIFKVLKVITRVTKPVNKLSNLQDRHIEVQFNNYELSNVTVSPETEF
jgi:transposase InsO family protein